ncbi:MAG: 16S rRNA (cytosine(1402)-N(4))-methyltransferase RsmH [Christensenellales bacterium]|jgi:16S rRNA (cytosine1402-N4)-methyltransferase
MAVAFSHTPIMLAACMEALNPLPGGVFVDGTLGGGGHAASILDSIGSSGRLYGIDRDADALSAAGHRLARYKDSFVPIRGNFHDMPSMLAEKGVFAVDGIMLDLGVSSFQLDEPSRGFSYNQDGPLDMRMDASEGLTAADVVNTYTYERLSGIIRRYGEERFANQIAGNILREREKSPILTTLRLRDSIVGAIPAAARRTGPHPAKRTFQAIRIEVNGELDNLVSVIEELIALLKPGGRLVVLTFHSLEDRAVKNAMVKAENPCVCPPSSPYCICGLRSAGKRVPRKPRQADEEEVEKNPRSRSAKLRCFVRTNETGA